ncbi:site-specific integrase [Pseudomonas sp. WS 5079]|uniref:site-specific integrase n=1 Tax=Pseudomonas sp. WS 5079 TaxID=2717492 RepID=UPI001555BA84|nr:site-specific integrase [Pseudomonas sp. WS 5079]NMX60324.1 site-specific integrase [Pseudomonas sp. WS 5079]
MQRSQSGFPGDARLLEALAPLPPLPSVIRYWDDFADCWRTIRNPEENVWSLDINGVHLEFEFSCFDKEIVKLIKLWLIGCTSELACMTFSMYFHSLKRLDQRLILTVLDFSTIPPLGLTDKWEHEILPVCGNHQLNALKSLLLFCCGQSVGFLSNDSRPRIASLRQHPVDKYARVRSGDVFLDLYEDRKIIDFLDTLNDASSHDLAHTKTPLLISACILCICYQFAMRPKQIAKLKVEHLKIFNFENTASVQLRFFRGKQRKSTAPIPMLRKIKREWTNLFVELHRRRTTGQAFPQSPGALADSLFGLTPAGVVTSLARLTAELGLDGRSSTDFRHSAAQRMVDAGATQEELAEYMGHSWSMTGLVYFESSPTQAERVNRALAISPIYSKIERIARSRTISTEDLSNALPAHQIGGMPHGIPIAGIGMCTLGQGLCAKNPVLSCYGCDRFLAVQNSKIHEEVRDGLRPVVLQFYNASRGESYSPAYSQLQDVLERVEHVIDELNGGVDNE